MVVNEVMNELSPLDSMIDNLSTYVQNGDALEVNKILREHRIEPDKLSINKDSNMGLLYLLMLIVELTLN